MDYETKQHLEHAPAMPRMADRAAVAADMRTRAIAILVARNNTLRNWATIRMGWAINRAYPAPRTKAIRTVMGVRIRTYVLDDGRRIINAEDFEKLIA